MKYSFRPFSTGLILAMSVAGCDGGSPSKSADDIAADSALAADLAIANRDTLLVDSIGEYRPADAAERGMESDTATPEPDPMTGVTGGQSTSSPIGAARAAPAPPSPELPASRAEAPSVSEPEPPTSPPASSSNPTPATTASRPSGPKKTGAAACNSPALEDQSECVRASLASADMRLNRIYRALITEMRRQEGVRGDKDPASVQRLRVAQRAWLVYRDTECRRRGRGREGRLWARPRVRCLGQFSVRRANELADNFSRLTAP
ncbi:MAG TPA: lysozyme inhibitor LprI family protein [Gemmatimonadaceae bacterium]|nr:lysozyme inhibitor LprI family protein [Gemmatimonadaceae bacterium]